MMTKKKLPSVLYVFVNGEGDDTYLEAQEKLENVAIVGENKTVGIYKLESTGSVSTEINLKRD